jgi:predicted restriction endonuclease
LNSDEARFLDGLYDGTTDGRVVDGEAEPRDEPALGDVHTADDDLASDIADIWHDPTLPNETERLALVRARLGQGPFRTRLVERWGGRCPVTGCSQEQALRASHMKPWRCSTNQERLDSANGLLLTANLDALFDRFLISLR